MSELNTIVNIKEAYLYIIMQNDLINIKTRYYSQQRTFSFDIDVRF